MEGGAPVGGVGIKKVCGGTHRGSRPFVSEERSRFQSLMPRRSVHFLRRTKDLLRIDLVLGTDRCPFPLFVLRNGVGDGSA